MERPYNSVINGTGRIFTIAPPGDFDQFILTIEVFMLNRNQFLLLLILAMSGAIFAYSLPDLVSWLKPIIIDWFRYSITAMVMVMAIIVIMIGVFLMWCCAKYGQYQEKKERKLYKDSNDIYEDHW